MSVETLGKAIDHSWRVTVRCAPGAARGNEARPGVRLWRGIGLTNARMDERPGFSACSLGEPFEVFEVRIAVGAASVSVPPVGQQMRAKL